MKVLWSLVRLCCVFLLIFLHASFGTAQKGIIPPASPNAIGRKPNGDDRGSSPSRPIGKPPGSGGP
ncbi:hypothetical protein I3843_15G125200 [Carya illinoinensis]|uniref:Uncharacterized protein n=1 Tax=Carya illinoinensis TaxID=32201 RepID=A0A8T1NFG3_CARIL|nr:hypothetical protein CIPAW_15G146000 [Carya illinoinensis]KAG7944871.1 hypothetical protein I3843_15G125200 [Carya illinoinensis]